MVAPVCVFSLSSPILQKFDQGLMGGMRTVGFEIFLRLKRHQKSMGKAIIMRLRAIVLTPLKGLDRINLFGQSGKSIQNLIDFGFGCILFELEENPMSQGILRGLVGS